MDRWESIPQPRHRRNNPSFSSSLLDAIYRSIDESDLNLTGGAPDPNPKQHGTAPSLAVTRLNYSFDESSSSHSSDSASIIRPKPVRTAPIQTRPHRIQVDPQPPPQKQKKQLRDHLRKSTSSSPSSPGAKLALFLNSLFASSHKKPKISTDDSSPLPSPSPSLSTSSASRSCLSKTPSTRRSDGSARSVRFVIDDGELAAARERERRRMMVEELLKGIEMETEEETEESDDDLFELENLAGIVSDELPVYETTDVGINSAIAKGLVV